MIFNFHKHMSLPSRVFSSLHLLTPQCKLVSIVKFSTADILCLSLEQTLNELLSVSIIRSDSAEMIACLDSTQPSTISGILQTMPWILQWLERLRAWTYHILPQYIPTSDSAIKQVSKTWTTHIVYKIVMSCKLAFHVAEVNINVENGRKNGSKIFARIFRKHPKNLWWTWPDKIFHFYSPLLDIIYILHALQSVLLTISLDKLHRVVRGPITGWQLASHTTY